MPLPGLVTCGHARYKTELLDQLAAKKAARSCGFKVKEDFMSWAPMAVGQWQLGTSPFAVKWHAPLSSVKPRRYGDFPQQSAWDLQLSMVHDCGIVLNWEWTREKSNSF